MVRIYGSGCAAFAICLGLLQPAAAEINAETDARAFIVREAEIRREKAGTETGGQQVRLAPQGSEDATASGARKLGARAGKGEKPRRQALAAPAGSDNLRALVARHAAAHEAEPCEADACVHW